MAGPRFGTSYQISPPFSLNNKDKRADKRELGSFESLKRLPSYDLYLIVFGLGRLLYQVRHLRLGSIQKMG